MKRTKRVLIVTAATLMVAGGVWLAVRNISEPQPPYTHPGSANDAAASAPTHGAEAHNSTLLLTASRPTMDEIRSRIDPAVFKQFSERTYYVSRMEVRPPGDALAYVDPLRSRSRNGDALATNQIYLAVTDCKDNLAAGPHPKGAALLNESQRLS